VGVVSEAGSDSTTCLPRESFMQDLLVDIKICFGEGRREANALYRPIGRLESIDDLENSGIFGNIRQKAAPKSFRSENTSQS
jgi:hypothetical protein